MSDIAKLLLTDDEITVARDACDAFAERHERRVQAIRQQFPRGWAPPDLVDASGRVRRVRSDGLVSRQDDSGRLPCKLSLVDLPLLRLALLEHIEQLTIAIEESARLTHLERPLQVLRAHISSAHAVLDRVPLSEATDVPDFSLSRYLNLETISRVLGDEAIQPPRVFDDKFHILFSQSLFLKDLRFFREQCLLRRRPVSVAYVDIDNFGNFNRNLPGKETQVDRDILPRFMSELEASVFGRGFAYREGGDEYLVLLPNCTNQEAAHFFDGLRAALAALTYPNGIAGPTVSIGVCSAKSTDRLTPLQIQSLANRAKAFAKTQGRNRVAGYQPDIPHSDSSLLIYGTG